MGLGMLLFASFQTSQKVASSPFYFSNQRPSNFSAASYGKSSTNEVENLKICTEPKRLDKILGKRPSVETPNNLIHHTKTSIPVLFEFIGRHLKSQSSRIESKGQFNSPDINPDTIPSKIVHINRISKNSIIVTFDKPLDPVFAIIPNFYNIDGRTPFEVTWTNSSFQVILNFETPIDSLSSTLKVNGVLDSNGNKIIRESFPFKLDHKANVAQKELVINEVMAAPKNGSPLPNAEYIEIYNTSDRTIELGGFLLKNSSRSAVFPVSSISPGEYAIIVDEDDASAFSTFGKVIGLSTWPRFVNSSDQVILCDPNDQIIDQLSYNQQSYGSSDKANNGYSLEVVNPFSSCNQSLLLKASEDPSKGTPGRENSIFDNTPDMVAPRLLKALVADPSTIILQFNESLNTDLSNVTWEFNKSIELNEVFISPENSTEIILKLKTNLSEKTAYQITVKDLYDCAGNSIDLSFNTANFQIPSEAEIGEIILNEILFNPRSGTPKFVEIYNHSSKYIDLANWKLANVSQDGIDNRKIIEEKTLIIEPFDYLVVTTDINLLHQEYPKGVISKWIEINTLPSYPIAEGSVVLLNPEESLQERFDYSDKFHHELIQNTKGVSLERFTPEHETNAPKNWHSAASTEGFATPGYKNSQSLELNDLNQGIQITPKVFLPDATGEQPFTTISYKMTEPGYFGSIKIYGTDGQLIKTICQNESWGIAGFYTWSGTNEAGVKVRPGYYIALVEMVHLSGQVSTIKKTIVVGSKLQ